MISYRTVQFADIPSLMGLSTTFLEGSPTYRHISRDYRKISGLFENAIFLPQSWFCMVAVDSNDAGSRIVAFFIGVSVEYHFSKETVACDVAIFVEPEYRKSRIAVKLVDKFRQWATDVGCREVNIGATTKSHGAGYEKMLNRLGYETVGFVTKKQIERV